MDIDLVKVKMYPWNPSCIFLGSVSGSQSEEAVDDEQAEIADAASSNAESDDDGKFHVLLICLVCVKICMTHSKFRFSFW